MYFITLSFMVRKIFTFYINDVLLFHNHHHHHDVHEDLGVFPVPWCSRCSWSLHLFLGRPTFLRPFALMCYYLNVYFQGQRVNITAHGRLLTERLVSVHFFVRFYLQLILVSKGIPKGPFLYTTKTLDPLIFGWTTWKLLYYIFPFCSGMWRRRRAVVEGR